MCCFSCAFIMYVALDVSHPYCYRFCIWFKRCVSQRPIIIIYFQLQKVCVSECLYYCMCVCVYVCVGGSVCTWKIQMFLCIPFFVCIICENRTFKKVLFFTIGLNNLNKKAEHMFSSVYTLSIALKGQRPFFSFTASIDFALTYWIKFLDLVCYNLFIFLVHIFYRDTYVHL